MIVKIRRLTQVLLAPIVVLIIAGLVVTVFIGLPGRQAATSALYKGPSAEINGVRIKDDEYNEVYFGLMRSYGHQQTLENLRNAALNIVINEELLRQALKERQIEVDPDELDARMALVREYYPTEEDLEILFRQAGVKDLKALEDFFREDLKRQTLYVELAEENGIEVTEDQIRTVYEAIDLSHILIATDSKVTDEPLSDSEALQIAEDIYKRIMDGENFARLAEEYSDDRETAQRGGRIGQSAIANFQQRLDRNFMETALQLAAGEVSRPVKTPYGYHIIRVEHVQFAEGEDWEKEKETIRKNLLVDQFISTRKIDTWLSEEQDKADIRILDPALRAYRFRIEEKWEEATLAYAKALKDKRYRRDLETYLSAVEAYRQIEDYETALEILAKTPEKIRREPDYALAKARVLHARGTVDEAREVMAAAVKRAGEDFSALNYIHLVLLELELTEDAEAVKVKIDRIQEKREQEREELERLFQEEQKKLEDVAEEE